MTPFNAPVASVEAITAPVPFISEQPEMPLIRILFYPDGSKREFDYDEAGELCGIDHGNGIVWLRSEHGAGWYVLSAEMTEPPAISMFNVTINQASGDLFYERDKLRITELPNGNRVCENLDFQE
ncbi:MAG: hypothetical protein K2W95_13010 [Candidatus Obscuribacterales bacterium]|nr:hypothetical protein [Candidatus Obscuribacterales bacterium]